MTMFSKHLFCLATALIKQLRLILMTCNAINGGGSTQPFGRNGVVTAAAGRGAPGNFASLKTMQRERYNYKDGAALWPEAPNTAVPRQASNYWSYKPRDCLCDVSAGFLGGRNPEIIGNRIIPVFAGLPDCSSAPVRRNTKVSNQFRRRAAEIANQPRERNGRQSVARRRCAVRRSQRCAHC